MLSIVFCLWPSFLRMVRVAAAVVHVLILILHFCLHFLIKRFLSEKIKKVKKILRSRDSNWDSLALQPSVLPLEPQ